MKINHWLLDINDKGLDGMKILSGNAEYFRSLCKKVYTYLLSFPSPTYCKYISSNRNFYFAIGHNVLLLQWSKEISEHDFCELIYCWAYKFFPHYTVSKKVERLLNENEMIDKVYEGKTLEELIFEKAFDERLENFKIEKIVIRDDQINVKINNKKYVLISRPDMPISQFISRFRKIESQEEKANFVKTYTKKILEVTHMKSVDIKYTGVMLENFFKVRSPILCNEPLHKIEGLVYKWGRFNVHFSSKDQLDKAREIIANFKQEYKSIKNIDSFITKEFRGKIMYDDHGGKKHE